LSLLHFLWQGAAIALVYALLLRCGLPRSASGRYVMGVAFLFVMALCVPVTLLAIADHHSREIGQIDTAPRQPHAPAAITNQPADEPPALAVSGDQNTLPSIPASGAPELPVPAKASSSRATPANTAAVLRLGKLIARISPYASAGYWCGVIVMFARVAQGFSGGRRLRLQSTPVTEIAMLKLVSDCALKMKFRAAPAVAFCRRIASPVVIGLFRPTILLPVALATGLTPEQMRAALLHELAHIRRFDLLVNIVQRVVEAVLFFHPAVWWLSRRISAERENACDDLALRHCPQRLQYADSLLRVAEFAAAFRSPTIPAQTCLAATGNQPSQLKRRLLRLLGHEDSPRRPRFPAAGVMLSALLVLALLVAPSVWQNATWAREENGASSALPSGERPSESASGSANSTVDPRENGEPAATLTMASWYYPEKDQSKKEKTKQAQRVKSAFRELQKIPSADTDKRIDTALEILRNFTPPPRRLPMPTNNFKLEPVPDGEPWASALRVLIQAGKPAVPRITAELDKTNRYPTIQALGFVLRVIGDARAVPALIRAVPRSLQPPEEYDYEICIPIRKNAELLAFLQSVDEDGHKYDKMSAANPDDAKFFSFGIWGKEVLFALTKLTGEDYRWHDIAHVALRGDNFQQNLERKVVLKYARAKAGWWSENWRTFLSNEKEAELGRITAALDQYALDLPALPNPNRTNIPCGRNVKVVGDVRYHGSSAVDFHLWAFDETPAGATYLFRNFNDAPQSQKEQIIRQLADLLKRSPCIIDLDTARVVHPPEKLVGYAAGGVSHEPSQELLDWMAKEGCHLVFYKVQPADSDQPYFVGKAVNVKLYLISNERAESPAFPEEFNKPGRFENLAKELRESKKFDLPPPFAGPFARYDENASKYDYRMMPAFVFITKEGTCGTIRMCQADPNVPGDRLWVCYIVENPPKD
jgi:beta-lactamase regulating signal transducer with metallopeptidase domain